MNTYIVFCPEWTTNPNIILTDFKYWALLEDELRQWCTNNLEKGEAAFEGSFIKLKDDKELVLFELRWS